MVKLIAQGYSINELFSQGYYTLSTHCERDPDTIYIDSAFIEISNGFVRCHCNVIGLTASGTHGIFNPAPTGHCSMVITRCPIIPSIT